MSNYTIYDPGTGKVLQSGTTSVISDASLLIPHPGMAVLRVTSVPNSDHIVGGAVVPLDPLPVTVDKVAIAADGTEELTISGIPDPTAVRTSDGAAYVVSDGEFIFTADQEGEYWIVLESPFYLKYKVEFNAT